MEYQKPKSAAKRVTVKGPKLEKVVLETVRTVATIVGDTLGPGGRPVIIERYEHDMPPTITKDGVTVFQALGFEDPTAQVIMEAMRDSASRTASAAGDGTTTATILAEALVRRLTAYCKANPAAPPQRVKRELEAAIQGRVIPLLRGLSRKCSLSGEDRKLLHAVAAVSANGDEALADAVLGCFDVVGDGGNVTILEQTGQESRYDVEKIDGYPVSVGYEASCGRYWSKFINDPGRNRVVMERPIFVCYHGRITEVQTIQLLLEAVGGAWGRGEYDHHNVVIVATGWSDSVLGQLAYNFQVATSINVFPLLAPLNPAAGAQGQFQFLQDVCAVTGTKLFDPVNCPLESAVLSDLGPGVQQFECARTTANVIGHAQGPILEMGESVPVPALDENGNPHGTYEDLLLVHVDALRTQQENPESKLDGRLLEERVGKCTAGIAKLKVIGSSNGEMKEKRDRADDAVCAVRGALKDGCLPGGGWGLLRASREVSGDDNPVLDQILVPALQEPFDRLMANVGMTAEEARGVQERVEDEMAAGKFVVYDAANHAYVDAYDGTILDSTPAVVEAIYNAGSIAGELGTLGGTVVFLRDAALERSEASASQQYQRDAAQDSLNEADERA